MPTTTMTQLAEAAAEFSREVWEIRETNDDLPEDLSAVVELLCQLSDDADDIINLEIA